MINTPGAKINEPRRGPDQLPLNYANPGGRTIQLSVIRARATYSTHRIGSLITPNR
jgi:hypothetical protein